MHAKKLFEFVRVGRFKNLPVCVRWPEWNAYLSSVDTLSAPAEAERGVIAAAAGRER